MRRCQNARRRFCRRHHGVGSFVAGDPVDVITEDGTVVARGLVTYDSEELPTARPSTSDLAAELGADYEREVVHRDDLVIVGATGEAEI